MGVVISKSTLNPLSFVSTIIGFVSFVFTLGTFVKVVWTNLETMSEASHEVHSYLTNLRTELLEERASIRIMRKQCKKYHRLAKAEGGETLLGIELDNVTLKTMDDTIKQLMKRFKELERPFLLPGTAGIDGWKDHKHRRRTSSVSPYYEHSAYASPPEKAARRQSGDDRGRPNEELADDEAFWAQRTQYADFNFSRRFAWLTKKSEAQGLFESLSRVQIRRIARQVGGISTQMHAYGSSTLQTMEAVRRMDERMNRIVGIRRVNE
ncbi:hypothetical protein DOTSEDRAFT_70555 [Dothistroma septosporum NZE10]|uniref:Uncharacterized protein n=1 Tax=Dothistroma septosporum (strain NZE10 / CBS 128990) TaxID=675120 RepID=N1PT78_DOTSN|nr:hypothetical protein DOTSEDRAFT_70555 [Dothistroma septosporum NZE10]